jgi:hypothetical protein
MGTPTNPGTEPTTAEIEKAVEDIEKQEERVDNAPTAEVEAKEKATLETLMERYDTMLERLDSIDKRLSEPTVPAPAHKTPEVVPAAETTVEGANETPPADGGKPKKRRLGAWG